MNRNCLVSASLALALGLWASASFAQTSGVMTFDGGADGTSWNQPNNWNETAQPDGTPTSGNPATPPTAGHTANVGGNFTALLSAAMPAQAAFRVRTGVGTPATFNLTGGTLNVGDDISVGQTAKGTMNMSGGSVTLGDDFFIDVGNFGSVFTMSGGTLHIIDRLMMANTGHLQMNGGEIIADDDFYIDGNSNVTVTGGLMSTIDKISMFAATGPSPARLQILGGIMRSDEWTDDPDLAVNDPARFKNYIQIGGSGKLQIRQANFPIAEAQTLISNGRLFTTAPSPQHLGIQTVIVTDFYGELNIPFTQISLVPEPASLALLGMCGIGLVKRRRRI